MAKKIFALLLAAMLVLSLAACDSKTDDSSNNGDNSNNDNSANTEVSGLTEAIAEYPALVTSGGQSADYQMIATLWRSRTWSSPPTTLPPPLTLVMPRR